MAPGDDAEVVVVGAGLAGLTAAFALEKAGRRVEVLEARDRIGGRTWSRTLENGAVVEMGAEFILPGNSVIRELASELGVGLWDKGVRYGKREPHGAAVINQSMLQAAAAEVDVALAELPPDSRVSATELLNSLPIDSGSREALLARVEISAASETGAIMAESLARLGHLDEEPSPSFANGNQMLSLALADSLKGRIRLADAAVAINWSEQGVEISVQVNPAG